MRDVTYCSECGGRLTLYVVGVCSRCHFDLTGDDTERGQARGQRAADERGRGRMNEPRFIVRESQGYAMNAGRKGVLTTEELVLDRGYCHRVVWSSLTSVHESQNRYLSNSQKGGPKTWRKKTWRSTARTWPLERRRRYAADLAARLNAEDVAA